MSETDIIDREMRRLAALSSYDVLDTPKERSFDEVAALAAQICETPFAVVNLIGDGRQFFKAEVGLGLREPSLEWSFCAKAILEDDFLLVPDAAKDPRFDRNPLVTGDPGMRFYAGALLKTQDGLPIGTLCVLDVKPRDLTPLQQQTLRVLANQVMMQLDLRRSLKQREASEARLKASQKAGHIGAFEANLVTGVLAVTPEFCTIFGVAEADTHLPAMIETAVIPEDRHIASNEQSRARGEAPVDVEYRIRRVSDGELRWIGRRAQFVHGDSGTPVRMFGTVQDITERKRAERRVSALLELGDRLHDASDIGDVLNAAAETLGQALGAERAGYALIDHSAGTFEVEHVWAANGVATLRGKYDLALLDATVRALSQGEVLAIDDVGIAPAMVSDRDIYLQMGTHAQIMVPLIRKGELVGVLFVHSCGRRSWTEMERNFARNLANRTFAALAKVRAEAEQALLNQELSHRLKNTLAVVQAIADQTLRDVSDRDAVEALTSRIIALSTAHDILLKDDWLAARLDLIAQGVLALHAGEGQAMLEGPPVDLGPRAGLSISLLLNELSTNAAKYGALSQPSGRVAVKWRVEAVDARPTLYLDWIESDGPPVMEPARSGFGSRLIQLGLLGAGQCTVNYLPTGLVASFSAPLARLQEQEMTASGFARA
jgi:PAS domain S-box-containing protein